MGSRRSEESITPSNGSSRNTDGIVRGITYVGRAFEQLQSRDFISSVFENPIAPEDFAGLRLASNSHNHFDSTNKVGVPIDIEIGRGILVFHVR